MYRQLDKEKILRFFKKTLMSPFFWILILSVFLLRTILFTSGIPHHGDLTYPTTIAQYQKALFPLWNESTSDSNLESIDRGISLLLVLFVRLIGGEVDLLSKLYFFIPLFLSGITTAYLTRYILRKAYPDKSPNSFAIILAAFVYMISPWVIEQVQAPFFWLSYAVTPGIILLAYRFFSERRLSFGIGLAIVWTIASTTPHYTLFSFLIILAVWLASYIHVNLASLRRIRKSFKAWLTTVVSIPRNSEFIAKLKKDLKGWVLLAGIFFALNAYWIITTAFMIANGSVTPGYVFTPRMLTDFTNKAYWRVLSGTDQWASWWPGQYSPFIGSLINLATIALPAVLIIALWLARKGNGNLRLFYILLGVWVVGLFFALGGNNPVYTWLATGAPLVSSYGWLLRVPGKISYLLWPAYAVSVGLMVQSAYSYLSGKKALRNKALVLMAVIALLVSSTGYAVIKADDYFNYYYAPVPVPPGYQQAFFYMSNNLTDVRVADLARYENGTNVRYENLTAILQNIEYHQNTSIQYSDGGNDLKHSTLFWLDSYQTFESSYSWNEHRIAGYIVPRSITVPSIGSYHFTYSGTWAPAYAHFQENVTRTLWKSWFNGTQLVPYNETISRLENINPQAVSWFPVYGVNYLLYHNDILNTTQYALRDLQMLNQTGCQLVEQWGDYIYLYRVPQTFGRIYTLNSSWLSISGIPPAEADIAGSGASLYNIQRVGDTLWQVDVNASKPFTLIFTEGFDTYWSATINSNGVTQTVDSQKIFGSINAFPINQTGELHITIQYKPQSWLSYGIAATVLSLLIVTAVLVVLWSKNRKKLPHIA